MCSLDWNFFGVTRIAIAIKKAREHKVKNTTVSIFESIKKTKTKEELFHESCEVVPVLGPLLYGSTKLCMQIAKKVNKIFISNNSEKDEEIRCSDITSDPSEDADYKILTGISSHEELKRHLNEKITLYFPKDSESHLSRDLRKASKGINIQYTGVLIKLSNTPINNDKKYTVRLKIKDKEYEFLISNGELKLSNRK